MKIVFGVRNFFDAAINIPCPVDGLRLASETVLWHFGAVELYGDLVHSLGSILREQQRGEEKDDDKFPHDAGV